MSYIPPAPENKALWAMTVVVHSVVPVLLSYMLIRYIQVEKKFLDMFSTMKFDLVALIRGTNLLFVAVWQACYLSYYFPVSSAFCSFSIVAFMGLPAISKMFVFTFYVLRYHHISGEVQVNPKTWVTGVLLVFAIIIPLLQWIPLWTGRTFVDSAGLCLVEFGVSFLPFFGVSFILEVLYGLFLLYLFTYPIETSCNNLESYQMDTKQRTNSTSESLLSMVRRTKATCYVSIISGFFSTFWLALVFTWYPSILWMVFLSDILVCIDTFLNCISVMYTLNTFNQILGLDYCFINFETPTKTATEGRPTERSINPAQGGVKTP